MIANPETEENEDGEYGYVLVTSRPQFLLLLFELSIHLTFYWYCWYRSLPNRSRGKRTRGPPHGGSSSTSSMMGMGLSMLTGSKWWIMK